MQLKKLKEGDEACHPASQLHKALYTINVLNCPEQGLTPTERHQQSQKLTVRPQFLWKDSLTCKWHGPSPVLMWGQGHACVLPEDAEHPVWVLSWVLSLMDYPGPKNEEAETRQLALGQGTAEADSFTNQRSAKETATSERDTEQRATYLGSN
jgi:hypothetical protein